MRWRTTSPRYALWLRQLTLMAHGNNNNRNKTALFLICSALLVLVFCKYHYFSYNNSNNGQEQPSSSALFSNNGSYKGTPWRTDRTIHVQTVAETKFARCDVHTVASEDGSSQINDWVFMEEMDAVNIIVMTAHDQLFPVFRQGKYAIPGETLSPVGGFVDAGEAPFESARREVMEELGLGSRVTLKAMQKEEGENTNEKAAFAAIRKRERTVDDFHLAEGDTSEAEVDWVFLGRYRTAANRGGGFIYTYLLKNAVPIVAGGGTTTYQMTGDDESQEIVLLSLEQIKNHMTQGHFQEVKWAATIALALLHLQNGHSSNA